MYDTFGYLVYRAVKSFGKVTVNDTSDALLIEHVDYNVGYYWTCVYNPITDDYKITVIYNGYKREANNEFIY